MHDETLFRSIAAQLSAVKFIDPLTESEHRAVRITQNLERGIRVYKLKGLRWAVNYYSAGAQRTWARPLFVDVACRIADMLTIRNADKRVRLSRVLTPDDFNISEARARLDNANEGEIVSLLIQMETCLPDKPARLGRPPNLKNRTLRDEVLHIFDTIMFRLNDVLSAQGTADKKLNELRGILKQIEARQVPGLGIHFIPPAEQPYSPPAQPGWPLPPGPTCVPSSPPLQPSTADPLPLAPTIFCGEVSGCR